MITEDYCSSEIAKLLKEKGFDGWCDYFYDDPRRQELRTKNGEDKYWNGHLWDDEYAAPTHQMAMKWLREAHKLSVEPISVYNGNNKVGFIYLIASMTNRDEIYSQPNNIPYDTYEEAVEAALKYCLTKLI